MLERENLEREVRQLRQIIRADAYALASKSTPIADKARLQKQIDIRTALRSGLLKHLSGDSTQGAAEPRGHVRKPKHIYEAKLTKGKLPQTRSALLARIKEIKQTPAKAKEKLAVHRP